ncbi:MAG: hypothetical protein DRP70_04600 [Spirochaetes bacterium]|nr:MAG: hypothetical protein DRP70_04600 [Spirochaetota bacterium]RKX98381.1 MAG: hypothetical protein DRZ90_03015 [Spirochaetota bacterium]
MKKVLSIVFLVMLAAAVMGCASLPEFVQDQSRKDVDESEGWDEQDSSGPVKFLQVQTTAPASDEGTGMVLDGSFGERLLEILTVPAKPGTDVVWNLKNKGDSDIYVVAAKNSSMELPVTVPGGEEVEVSDIFDDEGYTYLVFDNEGGGGITLEVRAAVGEESAKTTRGKYMKILWF